MNRYRPFAWPAYLICLGLIGIPLIDAMTTVWPIRLSTETWRFGAAGIFSRALVTTLLGFMLALLMATALEQRRTVRVGAILSGLAALVLAAAIVLFGLDAIQSRRQVRPEMLRSFDMTTVVALAKYGWAIIAYGWIAVVAWRGSRNAFARDRNNVQAPLIATSAAFKA